MRRFFVLIFCVSLIGKLSGAMISDKNVNPDSDSLALKSVKSLRITEKILLDGELNEDEWQKAPLIDEFMQFQPVQGGRPSERTEARILYDDNYIYVGIVSHVSKKNPVLATEMERDADFFVDDRVAVVFDTYHDRLNGVFFSTNPLGVRHDLEISQDGMVYDNSWNTFWNVSTSFKDSMWVAEFRIPFSSLRFKSKDELVMGFKIIRSISANNEFDVYPKGDPTISNYLMRLSMASTVKFENVEARKPFLFSPYAIANWGQRQFLNQTGTAYERENTFMKRYHFTGNSVTDKVLSNIGFNAKYGLSKNFTLDLTVNTDFSQVEVDNRIINLTRFEVNLPEKRDFFLEAQDYLNFDIGEDRVFNSRNIGIAGDILVPILAGTRLTGRHNGYQIGFLNMQTLGVQNTSIRPENFTNLRIRKSIINEGSTIGGIFTNRIATDTVGISNQVAGLDFFYRLNDKWLFDVKSAYSTNDFSKNSFVKNSYNSIRILKNASKGFFHDISLGTIGEDYNPEMGFIIQNDIAYIKADNTYITVHEEGKLYFLSFVNYIDYRHRLSTDSRETFYIQPLSIDFEMKNGMGAYLNFVEYKNDTLMAPWEISDNITIPQGKYKMWVSAIEWGANTTSTYTIDSYMSYGDFYGGKRLRVEAYLDNSFGKYFKAGLGHEFNRIRFPKHFASEGSSSLFISHLFTSRFTLTFSTKVSFKTYLQYDNLSKSMSYNSRFRYNPREGVDLYIVFNQNLNTNRRLMEPKPYLVEDQGVTVKYIHTFNLSDRK